MRSGIVVVYQFEKAGESVIELYRAQDAKKETIRSKNDG